MLKKKKKRQIFVYGLIQLLIKLYLTVRAFLSSFLFTTYWWVTSCGVEWALMKWLEAEGYLYPPQIGELHHYRPTAQFSITTLSPLYIRGEEKSSPATALDHTAQEGIVTTIQPLIPPEVVFSPPSLSVFMPFIYKHLSDLFSLTPCNINEHHRFGFEWANEWTITWCFKRARWQ